MPPRPPTNVSRPTLCKYYHSTQDAALATFLAACNRVVPLEMQTAGPLTTESVHLAKHEDSEEENRRVCRRVDDDLIMQNIIVSHPVNFMFLHTDHCWIYSAIPYFLFCLHLILCSIIIRSVIVHSFRHHSFPSAFT